MLNIFKIYLFSNINLKLISCDFYGQILGCLPTLISGVYMHLPGFPQWPALALHETQSLRQQDCSGISPDSILRQKLSTNTSIHLSIVKLYYISSVVSTEIPQISTANQFLIDVFHHPQFTYKIPNFCYRNPPNSLIFIFLNFELLVFICNH